MEPIAAAAMALASDRPGERRRAEIRTEAEADQGDAGRRPQTIGCMSLGALPAARAPAEPDTADIEEVP